VVQHKADQKDPSKYSLGVDKAVQVATAPGEFLTKVRQAWSGHSATPTQPVVAGRETGSATSKLEIKAHTRFFVIVIGAEQVATQVASGGRYG
jgi:hypothetical protein